MSVEVVEVGAGPFTFAARAAGPGDGRLVLLLHGFPQSSVEWRSQIEALAGAGYRAVAIDQRGYSPGARPDGVEHYAVAHLVADVLAVADQLGGHQFDLVGHDWGGAVAWLFAAAYPQRLRTLTSVSMPHPAAFAAAVGGGDLGQAARSSYIELFRQEGVAETALLAGDGRGLRALFAVSGHPDPDRAVADAAFLRQPGALTAALNWYRAVSPDDVAHAGPVHTPTLYVWSDGDVALGRQAAEDTAAHVEGPYRFEVLAGVSHWIPEHAPDELNRLLLEHLDARP